MKVIFLANARRNTLSREVYRRLKLDGYLVPPAYLTRTLKATLASKSRFWRSPTVIDDGLFDDITRISAHHALAPPLKVALKLASKADKLYARDRNKLPKDVLAWADKTANTIERQSRTAEPYPLQSQLDLHPTGVVGIERIDAALWFRTGLQPYWLRGGYTTLRALNAAVAALSVLPERHTLLAGVADLPVASACDYDSAYDAGRIFARAGVRSCSLPFGAFMADDEYADSIRFKKKRRALGDNLPTRAIRCASVARGFIDGWKDVSPHPPDHIHLLGLGQPIVLSIAALALFGTQTLSCDATSPFKDAAVGSIYTEIPVFRKLRTESIMKSLLVSGNAVWDCPCPFCRAVAKQQRWAHARATLRSIPLLQRDPHYRMDRKSQLAPHLPYFAVPGTNANSVGRALHNHWITVRCVKRLNAAAKRRSSLAAHVRDVLSAYATTSGPQVVSEAYRIATDIALGR